VRHESPEETEQRQHEARFFRWWVDPDGMVRGAFAFPPAMAAVIIAAVQAWVLAFRPTKKPTERGRSTPADASSPPSVTNIWPSIAQQQADALVDLVGGGGATIKAEIVVHVRGDGCSLDDGTPIAGSVVERIAPASFIRALIHDADSKPVNASGRQRHPTLRQKRVVLAREGRCVDCGSTELLQYDHVPDFDVSKRTLVDELWPRCTLCHDARHRRERGRP
jgi:hypothetical protein